jgi:hypothetical protein
MTNKWVVLSLLGLAAATIALLAGGGPIDAQQMRMGSGMMAGSAPAGMMMCDANTCKEHMAKMAEASKALDAAKKAADSGDAKAASAEISKASALLKEVQDSMNKMMGGGGAAAPADAAATIAVANAKCPILGGAVNSAKWPVVLTRDYKGQKVGFCCGGCPETWDKLSDADKDKKLADAMKPAPANK